MADPRKYPDELPERASRLRVRSAQFIKAQFIETFPLPKGATGEVIDGLRAQRSSWPPLRLVRVCCEHVSVCVASPAGCEIGHVVVRARGQLGHVVRGRVALERAQLAEIVDGVRGVGRRRRRPRARTAGRRARVRRPDHVRPRRPRRGRRPAPALRPSRSSARGASVATGAEAVLQRPGSGLTLTALLRGEEASSG